MRVSRAGAVLAGLGFGGALLVDAPAAGLVGLGLMGVGIANALPLTIGAGGNTPGETPATAAARVSTLGYLGSFVGPALVGGPGEPVQPARGPGAASRAGPRDGVRGEGDQAGRIECPRGER